MIKSGYAQTTQTYSTNGTYTWTCPASVTSVTVECFGAGGGGGSIAASTGQAGGGGGGAYSYSVVTVVPGTNYTVVVGLGGSAVTAGANSTFNTSVVVAAGGSAGASGANGAGGAGGTTAASTGSTTYSGGTGGTGSASGSGGGGGGGGAGSTGAGGNGASPTAGIGTTNNVGGNGGTGVTGNSTGVSGSGYGGGGSGASRSSNGSRTGGSGADGAVLITYMCPVVAAGTYKIGGATPDYATLTAAFTAINCGGISGNVNLVLQSGYSSAGETFPLTPSTNNGSYSVTIYPAASGLSITSANAVATLYMNGCSNYIVDGRVNQSGATNLVIANTNTSGAAIELINDATYNTIQYCDVQGINTTGTTADIFFSTASSTGNSNNTITYCNIHDGASTPYNCIYSSGTAAFPNSSNTISNCNIYNFFSATSFGPDGIDLEAGNTAWTISGNSFYQTSSRVPTASNGLYPILIENNTGTNYVIRGNYIGGTAASCGGGALTYDAGQTQDNYFYGILLSVGANSASFIQNNTIANIAWGAKCQAGSANTIEFVGINAASGYLAVTNNTIGSTTGNGSITVSLSTTSTQAYNLEGIFANSSSGSIANNNVGSITVSGGRTNRTISIRAMEIDGALTADYAINNNLIGSTTTANSIQYTGSTANQVGITGMFLGTSGATYNTNVYNNTIQNITNTGTAAVGTTGTISGIYDLSSSLGSITTNTIANINTAVATTQDIMGVYMANTTAGQTVANNYIHDLSNTYAAATATDIYGIYYSGPTTGVNTISANAIYNLTLNSTNTGSNIYGLYINSGVATTSNNMITLGNSVTMGYAISGIYQNSATAANNHYFNSIYIGGAAAAAGSNTNAFFSKTATHTIENNIFYNARTQAAGAGNHYAINVQTKTGVTSNYNDLLSSVAANLGSVNGGGGALTYANWQAAAPAGDANSINTNPSFLSPTAATPDLHISSASAVISLGLNGLGIAVDFDGNARNNPPSMGADENHKNYYSKSTGNLDVLGTWGTNTDGSGASPLNFTSAQCTYNIRNNAAPTLGAAWTVSGTGSNIVLGDGTNACNFTIPGAYSCVGSINISNNSTLTNQNATNPTLVNVSAGSTVNYNSANGVSQTVFAPITYGNLIISNSTGSGSSTKTLAANISVAGNLTVSSYATFDMITYNCNRTGGGGSLTVSANAILRLSGTTGGYTATNGGTTSFPINYATMALDPASTVEYYGATQTIYDIPTYGNLSFSTAGTKTAGGAHTVAGNLTINSPSTFAASTFTHNFKGNFINNGTFNANTSTSVFSGSTNQTISGTTASITFNNLTVQNTLATPSSALTLSMPVTVNGVLTLSKGVVAPGTIAAATNTLVLASGASTVGASNSSYVDGAIQKLGNTAFTFPVGTNRNYQPISIGAPTNTTDGFTAQYFYSNVYAVNSYTTNTWDPTIDHLSGCEYWLLNRTAGTSSVSVTLGWNSNSCGVTSLANLTVAKYDATANAWKDVGNAATTGNTSAGTIRSNTVGSFSPFTLASTVASPQNSLPIELLSFSAVPDGEKVDIKWETSTETNNDYFTIEKSKDGKTFTKLLDVKGAGTSTTLKEYFDADYQPYTGTSYYRLKQTDKNGTFKYFNMVPVNFNGQKNIVLFPNPIEKTSTLNVKISGYENEEVVVVLRDMQGKEFLSRVLLIESANQLFLVDEAKLLNPGTYIVTASSNDKIYNYKLIVK